MVEAEVEVVEMTEVMMAEADVDVEGRRRR